MAESHKLGIVILSLVGGEMLKSCLRRLSPLHDQCRVSIDGSTSDIVALQAAFPSVHFVDSERQAIPIRRQRAVESMDHDIVVLLEDTSLPEPGWSAAICSAFSDPRVAAAGGPVLLSADMGSRHQALGCGEYGKFHPSRVALLATGPPGEDGAMPVNRIPGNNMAYRRELLLDVLQQSEHGLIEGEVTEQLMALGQSLLMHPGMTVVYSMGDEHGARLMTRLQHGRLFASGRVGNEGVITRLVWFAKSLLLPVILSVRAMSSMTRAVKPASWPAVTLWIILMESAWSLGEGIGYLTGQGRSLEAWR
ncbi:MAG: hypothetical protein BMS9Abin09_0242 [Gammaproteobacteria bacterium]|nr:MAG: hypothetical protein BMS9Abin09_0242 [Gammaproteobacteria bacterium]